ncbi:large subunit ribosomal protein L3 [Thermosulfidibacter takaii ABI70S6]|uniref:Large ribosomal subunit protein uL3 n=1 Tax=Thermosulfidibacter takaii (strain DSM 17441 / JCM 13301 / NBRC 103674 / ABI70S6) TaxID=1298851 RepID=A0A0S3QV74_THET7|nr:50S ribosomal protein L3 [Thermosulfidibacter takaii]BAT72222.1 large subunit ribosomal protein L3 [Thermosulfidibacter takaii ABI70S6]
MVTGLLGKKLGMTQVFKEDGTVVPVTVIQAGPCWVVQKRTPDKDGYAAVQIGMEQVKEKNVNKPMAGHFKKHNVPYLRHLKEIRLEPEDLQDVEEGQVVTCEIFEPGEKIKVTGWTKGRGFAGVMKRHGMGGSRDSHGARYHRVVGSIGMCTFPARVHKGKRMPGHMGTNKVTVRNLEVVAVYPEKNLVLIKGAVPGYIGSLVILRKMR